MIKIRNQIDSDAEDVKFITSVATEALRSIYRPTKTDTPIENKKTVHIVAIVDENIVGSAEYVIHKNDILVRGLAVSSTHRRQGVAKAIINYIALWALKEDKSKLTLSTIKETGNITIFLHMGFSIDSEETSELYEGINYEQVTIVNMSKNLV